MKRANFLYFLGTNANPAEVFVYGLSITTICDISYSLEVEKVGNVGNKNLYRYRAVKEIAEEQFTDDTFDLNLFSDKILNRNIKYFYKKRFVQGSDPCTLEKTIPSPVPSVCEIDCFYIDEYISAKIADKETLEILELLKENSSLPFYGIYSRRLGCFDFTYTQEWSETQNPFHIDVTDGKLYFYKDISYLKDVIISLKIFSSSVEKSFDKLIFVPANCERMEIVHDYENDIGYEHSVYDSQGKLLHDEKIVWFSGKCIISEVSTTSKKVTLDDRYSKQDSRLATVVTTQSSKSTTYLPGANRNLMDFNGNVEKITNLISNDAKNEISGKWFSKSQNDTVLNVVEYLNKIIKHFNAKEIVIIDPYLDEDIISLCARINCEISISVISSKQCIVGDALYKVRLRKEKIEKLGLPASKLNCFILSKKFHDRFIMLKTFTGQSVVYCLPSSVNAILKNDDFIFIKLEGKLRLEAISYINELVHECDGSKLLENAYNE